MGIEKRIEDLEKIVPATEHRVIVFVIGRGYREPSPDEKRELGAFIAKHPDTAIIFDCAGDRYALSFSGVRTDMTIGVRDHNAK